MNQGWRAYWEKTNPDKFMISHLPRTEKVRELYFTQASEILKRGNRILDVGCGPAMDYPMWRDAGYRYFGVDFTQQFIDYANEKYGEEANLSLMDAKNLQFKNRRFHLAYSKDLLEHQPPGDWRKIIRELWRVTSKLMIISFFLPPWDNSTKHQKRDDGVWTNTYNKTEVFNHIMRFKNLNWLRINESMFHTPSSTNRKPKSHGWAVWTAMKSFCEED